MSPKLEVWLPEGARVLDNATERLMSLLVPLLRLQREQAYALEEALDDFVRAHMERRDEERREREDD